MSIHHILLIKIPVTINLYNLLFRGQLFERSLYNVIKFDLIKCYFCLLQGRYMTISEVKGPFKNSILIPENGWDEFKVTNKTFLIYTVRKWFLTILRSEHSSSAPPPPTTTTQHKIFKY